MLCSRLLWAHLRGFYSFFYSFSKHPVGESAPACRHEACPCQGWSQSQLLPNPLPLILFVLCRGIFPCHGSTLAMLLAHHSVPLALLLSFFRLVFPCGIIPARILKKELWGRGKESRCVQIFKGVHFGVSASGQN